MPIFEAEGKKYNVQDAHIAKFAQKYPKATTIMEKNGQKYKVKASGLDAFNAKYSEDSTEQAKVQTPNILSDTLLNNSELHPDSTVAQLREDTKKREEAAEKAYNESEVIYNEDKPYRPASVPQPTQAPAEGIVKAESDKLVQEQEAEKRAKEWVDRVNADEATINFRNSMAKHHNDFAQSQREFEENKPTLMPAQREYKQKMDEINQAQRFGKITPQEADAKRRALETGYRFSSTPTDDMIRRTNARGVEELSKEIEEQKAKRYNELDAQYDLANPNWALSPTQNQSLIKGDQEYRTLMAAENALNDAQKLIDEVENLKSQEDYAEWRKTFNSLGRGAADKLFDVRTWDMGVKDMADATMLYKALDKADAGEELTDAERSLLDAKAYEMAVNAYFGSDVSRAYKLGGGLAQTIPFMFEMAINPVAGVGSAAQNKLVRYALKKLGKGFYQKKLKYNALKYGTRLLGDLAGGAGLALTSSLGSTSADAISRMNGQVKPQYDKWGEASFGGTESGVSAGKAIRQAVTAATLERFSEMLGYYPSRMLRGFNPMDKMLDKPKLKDVKEFFDKASHTTVARGMREFQNKTRWDGHLSEYFEEVANNVLNGIFVGDMKFDTSEQGIFNRENNIDTYLQCLIMAGGMSAIQTGYYPIHKYKQLNNYKKADSEGAEAFGDEWEGIKSSLSQINEFGKQAWESLMEREDVTPKQKEVATRYFGANAALQAAEQADFKRVADENTTPEEVEISQSYAIGRSLYTPEEMNEAKRELEGAKAEVRRTYQLEEDRDVDEFLGETPLESIRGSLELGGSMEEAEIKLRYLNAKAKYDGMLDAVSDKVNDEVTASNRMVDSLVNKDMGGIVNATITSADSEDGEAVTIVSGVIATDKDGNIDRDNTDSFLVYKDKDGSLKPISKDRLMSAQPMVDVEAYKEQLANEIKEQRSNEEGAKIDGILPMNVGDTFYVMDERGLAYQAQVTGNFEDGSVAISLDNDNPQQMPREAVQAMANAYKDAEYQEKKAAQEEKERADMQQTEAQLQQEEDEKKQAQEQAQQAEQPETATSRVPVGENGNLLYEQADSDTAWDALVEQAKGNEATAQKIADMGVKKAQKALDEVKQSTINEDMTIEEMLEAENAHNDAVAAAEANLNKWKEIASVPQRRAEEAQRVAEQETKAEAMQERIDKANEAISEEQKKAEQRMRMSNARAALQNGGRYQSENAELGAPIDFADFVMRAIATGGVRFIWGNNQRTGTRGLGSHTGFGEQERRNRIGILSNSGLYPEVAAEQLLSSYADEIGYDPNIDTSDALSTILDVVMSYTTPKEMMEAAQARHAEVAAKEADAAEIDAEEAYYRMMAAEHNMTVLEYMNMEAAYEELKNKDLEARDAVKEEIDAIFVEQYLEDYDNERRNEDLYQGVSGQTRSGASNEGGSNVLPSAQSDNTRAAQRSAEGQGATAQVGIEGGSDLSASQTLGEPKSVEEAKENKSAKANKMLSEEEYINQEVAKAIPEGMTLEAFEETDEYMDAYNEAADGYSAYVKSLADSGELQQMFDSATIGEQIAIRKNVEATNYDIHDLIDTKKNAPVKKTKKTRGQELMENLGLVYTKEADSTPQMRADEGAQPAGKKLSRAMNMLRIPLRKRANMWSKKVGVPAVIVEDFSDVTSQKAKANILEAASKDRRVTGWVEDGKVYLYMPNLRDIDEIDETYIHEVVAHKGMDAMLGKEEYRKFCLDVFDQVMTEADRKTYLNYEGVSDLKDETEKKAKAADEYIAHLSESTNLTKREAKLWDKIVDLFRKMLESLGFPQNISKLNIEDMIRKSYNNLLEGKDVLAGDGKIQFSVKDNNETELESANTRFNEELQQQIEGTLPKGHIYQLGLPSEILKATGIPELPIQLNSSKLQDKSTNYGHNYNLEEIKDLVKALHNPIAVFAYGDKKKAQNIVVEIQSNDKNFVIGLALRPKVGGRVLEINSIRNVFPKDNAEWLNWIAQGKSLYLDKERIQTLITQQQTNLADVDYLDLNSITKIIKDFDNPTIEATKNESNPQFRVTPAMDAEYMDAVERGDMDTAQRLVDEAARAAGYSNDESWKKSHRAPRKSEEDVNPFNTEELVPADYWTHPEWYTQIRHNNADRESYYNMVSAINEYKRLVAEGKQDEADKVTVKMYRGVDKTANTKEASFRNGDWITPSRTYAKTSAPYGRSRIIEQEVPLKNIWWDGNSINEWGYDDGANYTYKDTKNNRKLFDAVTYDDNGNVIPLSQRFNSRNADIRFRTAAVKGLRNALDEYNTSGITAFTDAVKRTLDIIGGNNYLQNLVLDYEEFGDEQEFVGRIRDIVGDGYATYNGISFRIAPTFYSNAERAVENIKQEKATPEQWLKMIEKNGGLKAGEDKWLGLSDWLKASDKKTLTKQEVLDYIKANEIQIEEVVYGSLEETPRFKELRDEYKSLLVENGYNNERTFEAMVDKYGDDFDLAFEGWGNDLHINSYYGTESAETFLDARDINDTRIQYTTDGLNNKREIALVVPTIESWNESDEIHFGDAGNGRAVAWVRFGETTDADGNRVLVIDEIQSNRHQYARENGYRSSDAYREVMAYRAYLSEKYPNGWNPSVMTAEENETLSKLNSAMVSIRRSQTAAPEAPFEKNWAELAMKRMLRYAAENGFDKVAWTTGEQQAERYSLAKLYDWIEREDNPSIDGRRIVLAGGNYDNFIVDNTGIITSSSISEAEGKSLADVVGKDMSERMMALEDGDTISGDGLRIGGEGMKAFYDKLIPSFMNKYGKKWGVKVGEVTMPNLEENNTMHSVDVTPAMRESVMQGQPMFRVTQDKARFDELQEEYDALDKNNEAALNAWRDKKKLVVGQYIREKVAEFALPCKHFFVYDSEKEADLRKYFELFLLYVEKLTGESTIGENTDENFESFKNKVFKNEGGGYIELLDLIVIDTSISQTEKWFTNCLFHEEAHAAIKKIVPTSVFPDIWKEVKTNGYALASHIEESYNEDEKRGEEVLTYSIGSIAQNPITRPLLEQFIKGEGDVVVNDILDIAKSSLPLRNEYLTKILNFFRDERRKEKGDDIRVGVLYPEGLDGFDGLLSRNRGDRKRGGSRVLDSVSQKGLRGVVSEDALISFFKGVYNRVDNATRNEIYEYVKRNGDDFWKGTEQYLASLAESNAPLDGGVRDAFVQMLNDNGIEAEGLTDNDIRYMMWRTNQLQDNNGALSVAEDVVMKQKLGVDNAQPTARTSFRVVSNGRSIRDKYDKRVNTGKGKLKATAYNFQEAMQDEMLSLKIYQQLLEEVYGVNIPSYLNVYNAENSLSSRNKVEMDRFVETLYEDMMQEIDKLIKAGASEQEVRDYVVAKSGIERSIEFTVRDYINEQAEATLITEKEANEQREAVSEKLRNNEITPAEADYMRFQINQQRNTKKHDAKAIEGMRKLYEEKRDALRERLNGGDILFDKWVDESLALAQSYTGKKVTDAAGLTDMAKRMGLEDKDWLSNARKVVNEFEKEYNYKRNKKDILITTDATDTLWKAINSCNKATLNKLYDTGVISKDLYDKLQKQFMFYVPMSGFTEDVAEDVYSYIGNETGAFTPPIKKAGGRLSESDDPFAIIGNKMQSAILQGNRNAMKIKFLNLHRQFPTDLITEGRFWEVKQPDGSWQVEYPEIPSKDASAEVVKATVDEFNERMKRLKESGDARIYRGKANVPYKITHKSHENQHQITVRLMGEPITMFVNGNPQLAKAINGKLKSTTTFWVYNVLAPMNRYMSSIVTSFNPDFVAPNVVRDVQQAFTMTLMDYGVKDAGKLAGLLPKALATTIKYANDIDIDPEIKTLYEEFLLNGGQTGYSHIDDVDKWKSRNKSRIDRLSGVAKVAQGAVDGFLFAKDGISTINGFFEDTTRFATYMLNRQNGKSIGDSIKAAKDISTNFNKKGSGATEGIWGAAAEFLRHWIMFFNPMVQGAYQHWDKMKKHTKKYALITAWNIGLGFTAALLNDMGSADDDEEMHYLNQNEYTRRSNLFIYIGGRYIKIPLAPVFREYYAIGDIIYTAIKGRITAWQATKAIFNTVRSIFSLEGQSSLTGKDSEKFSLGKFVAPDAMAVIPDIVTNANFMGSPIYRDAPWDELKPEYEKVYNGTWQLLIDISKGINNMMATDIEDETLSKHTGKIAAKNSSILINPAVWQYAIEQATGGIGSTIGNTINTARAVFDPEREVEWNSVPIIRRFYTVPNERNRSRNLQNDYYEITQEQKRRRDLYDFEKADTEGKADEISKQLQAEESAYLDRVEETKYDSLRRAEVVDDYHTKEKIENRKNRKAEENRLREQFKAYQESADGQFYLKTEEIIKAVDKLRREIKKVEDDDLKKQKKAEMEAKQRELVELWKADERN